MKRIIMLMLVCGLVCGVVWAEDSDMLTKITTVFQGDYSRQQIQTLLDEVIAVYKLAPGERTYEQVASVALDLRKTNDVLEMEILACSKALGTGFAGVEYPQAAASCATLIQAASSPYSELVWKLQAEQRIAALEARITELEDQLSAVSVAPDPTPTPKPLAPEGVPEEVDQEIRERMAEKYPDKFSTQEMMVKMERECYLNLQTMTPPEGVPGDIFEKIVSRMEERYDAYCTREMMTKMEVESYLKLQK